MVYIVGLNDILLTKIRKFGENLSENNKEGIVLYTDFYLDQLRSDETILKIKILIKLTLMMLIKKFMNI